MGKCDLHDLVNLFAYLVELCWGGGGGGKPWWPISKAKTKDESEKLGGEGMF